LTSVVRHYIGLILIFNHNSETYIVSLLLLGRSDCTCWDGYVKNFRYFCENLQNNNYSLLPIDKYLLLGLP